MLEPEEGLLTFRAEGNNVKTSRNYTRVIHWTRWVLIPIDKSIDWFIFMKKISFFFGFAL